MRNAILAILFLTASPAFCQFGGGGGCPSGGLVDRYSDQSISGAKSFCSTATFNVGMVLGLGSENSLSTVARSTPTENLYWGNLLVCTSTACGGGGYVPPYTPAKVGGGGGTPGGISLFTNSDTLATSIISQNDSVQAVSLSSYSLVLVNPQTSVPTVYKSTAILSTQSFAISTMGNVDVESAIDLALSGLNSVTMQSVGGTVDIKSTNGKIEVNTGDKILLSAGGDVEITTLGDVIVNGDTALSGGYTCSPGQLIQLQITKGLIVGVTCN